MEETKLIGKQKRTDKQKAEARQGWSFVAPALAILTVFIIISVVYAIYLSFNDVNLFQRSYEWVGLDNYARIFRDTKTKIAFWNTTRFVLVVVPFQTIIAIVVASVLNSNIKGKVAFRLIYFLPTLTSSAALTMIFMFLFSISGPINEIFISLGFYDDPINFLNDPSFALRVIMVMNIWSTVPFFMVIYFAGMQDIPTSLYEAAEIDGCNALGKFRYVTVPHLRPITTFVLLMGIIGTFQMFDQAFIFSNGSGGPENSTLTIALLIYRYAFGMNNTMGYATALAIVLSIVIFTASYLTDKLNKAESLY